MIIAIDGPAAAGKGTLARRLAAALGLPYLDTGLLYRAVGRLVLDAGADPADPAAGLAAASRLSVADLARSDLRGAAVDLAASQVASVPGVRAALLAYQRDFGRRHGAVLDGRDIGTIVFPDAEIKLFVTAGLDARAARRHAERTARGEAASLQDIRTELAARDEADANRAAAPLIRAKDAEVLDTTEMDAQAAFDRAMAIVNAARA